MKRRHLLPKAAILGVLAVLAGRPLASAGPSAADERRPRVASLKIVVLSTMLADHRGVGEWGFSAYVEADGRRLLFDTGARPRTVLENARELGIDLARVDTVVLSHNHGDHTGGLLTLRAELANQEKTALATAHVGRGIFWPRPNAKNTALEIKDEYEKGGGRFVEHAEPAMLHPGVWLTGPVPRPFPEKNWSGTGRVATEAGEVEDTIPEDQSLVFDTDRGLVVLSGCGHAGIVNIATHARKIVREAALHALVGGFHLFPLDDTRLDWTADQLRAFGVQNLVGAHCTGIEAVYRLREKLGLSRKTAVVGAVGASFSLDSGIQPGDLAR
jgi:7,8-dihydropterin-6-yl-methyl-4-(beta-D-ribofuranosyl)aminobenzene 5'-phosphate synthase